MKGLSKIKDGDVQKEYGRLGEHLCTSVEVGTHKYVQEIVNKFASMFGRQGYKSR